jgi:hypothetical protein
VGHTSMALMTPIAPTTSLVDLTTTMAGAAQMF